MSFSVEKDGVDLGRAGRVISGPFYRIFVVDVPSTYLGQQIAAGGQWRLNIRGTSNATYEAAAIVEESQVEYRFAIGGSDHVAGDALPINARVVFAKQPVTDAHVTARVLAPRQSLATLLSTRPAPQTPTGFAAEPGATAAQRKLQLLLGQDDFYKELKPAENPITLQHTGNGNYSATFSNTAITGPYTVVFRVDGTRADIGAYDRTESRSVTVRFGRAVLSASDLRVVPGARTPSGRQYELHVRPVDASGNYLGPDYGHRIAVTVAGQPIAGPPQDQLDGSYVFPFVAQDPSANVTVNVVGNPLYNGPLALIPTAGTRRFAVSGHLGVAIPVTGFVNADAGFLWEVDFEYRATPSFSVESVFGRYDFGPDGVMNGWTFYAKRYVPAGSSRFYVAAGPGIYKPAGVGTQFGMSVAAGVNRAIATQVEFDGGASYSQLFGTDHRGFLALRAGIKVTF
jgi:hypothetical protein